MTRIGPENILQKHGRHFLLTATDMSPCKSLFPSSGLLSQKYVLTDHLLILQSPPTPCQWKSTFKSKVIDWFEQSLRGQADLLPSIVHFKPAFMSFSTPHPLWTSAGSAYKVSKAVIDARMLFGRLRTDGLTRPWRQDNPYGLCRLPWSGG